MDRSELVSRVRGCFVGVADGDALGLPWETKSAAQILAETGGLGVTRVTAIPADHQFASVRGLPFGSTSDDWSLTGATARAIVAFPDVRGDAFRLILAREYAHELLLTGGKGWGKGTKTSIREEDRWLRGYADGRSPLVAVPPQVGMGSGNGVAMRIAALAVRRVLGRPVEGSLEDDVLLVGRLTHGDLRASIAAFAAARVLELALRDLDPNLVRLVADVRRLERRSGTDDAVSRSLSKLLLPATLATVESLAAATGTSTLSWESVPFSIGVYLRHARDPRAAILEAINAGGDTDSNAAIVGGLVGARNGVGSLPAEWANDIPSTEEAMGLGERLAA